MNKKTKIWVSVLAVVLAILMVLGLAVSIVGIH